MKNRHFLSAILLSLLVLFFNRVSAQAPADPSSIIGKVVCGYQGWFTAQGDGSPINTWSHWSIATAPKAGVAPNPNPNLTFDLYPDVSMYDPTSLFQTDFANLGDNTPSKLFASIKQDVTDKHFELMQKHGIDGVAFQRFIWEVLVDSRYKANRDSMAVHVRKSAEKYQRMFYLVYDLSGLGNVSATSDQVRFDSIKGDWKNNMLAKLNITSSPMYAKQDGKPVVQIWGIGYNHIIGTAAIQLDLINWFKAQGCYVIIGVPIDWQRGGATGGGAAKAGWVDTYLAANMVSPWSVGAYSNQSQIDNFKTYYLSPDLAYCNTKGIIYQPVIFPGFSWYNWNSGTKNQIPRNKGEFLWRQTTNLRSLGITSAEIAMFDEYDEGTAIMSIADGYDMIPTDQYFVTSSADGTYLSSDFYLRLAAKASRVIKTLDVSTPNVTIPYSTAPLFFRTSNEVFYDPIAAVSIKSNSGMSGTPTCTNSTDNPHRGLYSLKASGTDNSTSSSNVYFNTFSVDIPVSDTTELSFWTKPTNNLGRYVSIDLLLDDGTALKDKNAFDINGIGMHPATGRGTLDTWTKTSCKIGQWLSGRTIKQILIAYDHDPEAGTFTSYIDDIMINEKGYSGLPLRILSFTAQATKDDVLLKWQTAEESGLKEFEIERSVDGNNFSKIQSVLPAKSGSIKNYTATDVNVSNTTSNANKLYYRLRCVDLDNKITFSKIQVVNLKRKTLFAYNPFPNPFTDKIELSITAENDGLLKTIITDVTGKTIVNRNINVKKGTSKISIAELERLTKGIYFLKLTLGNETTTFKIDK